MKFHPASFKDPSGQIFYNDNKIYRSIFDHGVQDYEAARDAGIFNKLIAEGLLISHSEQPHKDFCPKGTVYCLNHPLLPMVSYPWEWPFSMLKDAALLHLDIMEKTVPEGFWLRDANAFNIQYDGRKLRLIDTLSIGPRIPDSPWVGYRQFCSHFIAPLALAAYRDIRTLALWRNYMDGFPLDLAKKLLPRRKQYLSRLTVHLTLHSRLQESSTKKNHLHAEKKKKVPKVSDQALLGLIRSLRNTVESIKWHGASKIWKEYENIRTYDADDISKKSDFVTNAIDRIQPKTVWDLGGNTGEFSFLAAAKGAFVVSIDGDPVCTEYIYTRLQNESERLSILPLTMDLSNPSPALGWDNKERSSLSERGPADLIMALALIHHLVFSSNVPITHIAEWLNRLTNHLIIEYIPIEDPMVKTLLQNRRGEHLPYSKEEFLTEFGKLFEVVDKTELHNHRELFLFHSKKSH